MAGVVEPAGLTALVAEAHATWEPRLARAVLGTDDAASVAGLLAAAVADAVGVRVTGARFYRPGVGRVAGLELDDGRAVVAKVHRWRATPTTDAMANARRGHSARPPSPSPPSRRAPARGPRT